HYPKKIKIGRTDKITETKGLVTFFRKGYLKRFYITNSKEETSEITFEKAIELVKAEKNEISKKVSKSYYDFLKLNKEAFEQAEQEDNTTNMVTSNKRGSSNSKNIIKILKECLKIEEQFTDIEIDNINKMIDLLENGELPVRIIKEANKEIKKIVGIKD